MPHSQPTFFEEPTLFREWLEKNSQRETELVVGFWKVGSGRQSMNWSESVDEALCFGWIDGVRRRIDEQAYSIRFSPRRAGSIWSAVNIAKFNALLAAGRITKEGKDAFKMRKEAKSKVYSYEQKQPATLTNSEMAQFRKQRNAKTYFDTCPPGYKKKMIHWVTSAKKPETRARRLEKLIAACAKQERVM